MRAIDKPRYDVPTAPATGATRPLAWLDNEAQHPAWHAIDRQLARRVVRLGMLALIVVGVAMLIALVPAHSDVAWFVALVAGLAVLMLGLNALRRATPPQAARTYAQQPDAARTAHLQAAAQALRVAMRGEE